jgi:6-pyruvoyltetrahydropterin/6-carboxytetrahydropterin synthase
MSSQRKKVTLLRRADFVAAHYFWVDAWTAEQNFETFGVTANRFGHGHNYELIAAISGEVHPDTGMVMNLKDVKKIMNESVIQPLDFKCLNRQVPFFQDNQPSLEALSVYLYKRLERALSPLGMCLEWVEIRESRELSVLYNGSPIEGVCMDRVFEPSIEDAPHLQHLVTGLG